jgi:hypothetical protein
MESDRTSRRRVYGICLYGLEPSRWMSRREAEKLLRGYLSRSLTGACPEMVVGESYAAEWPATDTDTTTEGE